MPTQIADNSQYNSLPLPHPTNELSFDVSRIRAALVAVDNLFHQVQVAMASDDTALDTVQELVTRIKSDEGLISSLTTGKVNVSDIIDNLTSTATNKPLSAKQGKALYDTLMSYNKTIFIYKYVATANQTVFSGADANGVTLSYLAGSTVCILNGAVLIPGDDYTATNGVSIGLNAGCAVGDELMVLAFDKFQVADAMTMAQANGLYIPRAEADSSFLKLSGGTMTGILNLLAATIGSATDPTNANKTLTYQNAGKLWSAGLRGDTSNVWGVADETAIRLSVDGGGRVFMPFQPSFYAFHTDALFTVVGGIANAIVFNSTRVNIGSCYNVSNGRFTAPVAGVYEFFGSGLARYQSAATSMEPTFWKNGVNVNAISTRGCTYANPVGAGAHVPTTTHVYLTLAAGDYVQFGLVATPGAGSDYFYGQNLGFFGGRLIG